VDLYGRAGDKFKTYSQGMKQRLAMAAALLNDPALVFLDEPTNGLDPAGMVEVRDLIKRLGESGKTVFLSSHLLHEVEQVCDRVTIVQRGRVVVQGTVQDLLNGKEQIEIHVDRLEEAARALQELSWVTVEPAGNEHLVLNAPLSRSAEVNQFLASRGLWASQIVARRQSLEQYFLDVTGGETSV
jgi:ABC-2 type transport system ATP-binding protein